jgi:excisionase family DNA binding protein
MRPEIEPTETTATPIPVAGNPGIHPPTNRPRKRGRPLGSRNRPKDADSQPAIKPAAMRPEQAAAYIGVSVTTVRRLIGRGELEKRRIGSALVVLTRSLDAFLERAP